MKMYKTSKFFFIKEAMERINIDHLSMIIIWSELYFFFKNTNNVSFWIAL